MPPETPLRAGVVALLAATVCMSPRAGLAAEPGYQLQLGVIESDNIERLPTGGTNETIGVLGLGFDWHDKRPWFDADIDADMNYLDYFPHTYAGQFIGNVLGTMRLNLAPDYLSWDFAENFGQVPLQPLAPITPGNQQNLNYFSTGPALTLPLGQTTQLDVTGQYGRIIYQLSPLNSTILSGGVGLVHELSTTSDISVNVRDDSMRFDNDVNPNYDRQDAFAHFDAKGSRTTLGIDLGYSHLQFPGANSGTPLVRLDVSRRVSASSTIGLAAGHDYSDGADSFRLVQGIGGATLYTQPVLAASAPFVGNYGTVAWNFQQARTTLGFSASYFRDRYQTDATLNNERALATAAATRQLTPSMQLGLTEDVVRWHFDSGDESATTSDTALQLTWRVGPRVSVFLAYYLAKGEGNVPGIQYTENRIWLSVGYGRAAEVPPGPAPLRLPGAGMQ